jgi:uncharacterized protein
MPPARYNRWSYGFFPYRGGAPARELPMTAFGFACLIAVFLLTALVSVVTGGTSLITVPVMMQLGMEPHIAVATNMLSLTLLSLGGTVPFLKGDLLPKERLPVLICLTLLGSIGGAVLLLAMPARAMPVVVAGAMLAVVTFTFAKGDAGQSPAVGPTAHLPTIAGYGLTFLVGVYGGFFSGGYVAMLMTILIACFHMTFLEAVAATKVLNLFSSLVATAVLAARGLIDWKLGLILGVVSFGGGIAGATVALRLDNRLLRRVFLTAVIVMAAKTLIYDVHW